MVRGAELGAGPRAARIAVLLSERGLGGDATDLTERLDRFARDGSPRTKDARVLADRWAKRARSEPSPIQGEGSPLSDGALLALAYPERVAKARGADGVFNLVSGRAVRLEPTDALARAPWLAIGELSGTSGAVDRVRLAAALTAEEIEAAFAERITEETRAEVDGEGRLRAERVRRLGALTLERRRLDRPAPDLRRAALLDHLRRSGPGALPFDAETQRLRARVAFLAALEQPNAGEPAWPDLSDAALLACADDWLAPLLDGVDRLAELAPGDLRHALLTLVPYALQRRLDAEAPDRLTLPTGTQALIDYAAEGGARVEARVQELFGLAEHPTVGRARTPLTLSLLSPARRQVAVTRALPGFWRGAWREVRTEMKARYPRHPWPEDPVSAQATTRAKPRGT
jgi:ATP-dependent helicase HrpB